MVAVKKHFHLLVSKDVSLEMTWQTIDDFKLVTVSNTEYELEMITGLDDIINFCQKFCKSIIISKFLFASFWISQTDLTYTSLTNWIPARAICLWKSMKCKWELWKNNILKKSDIPQLINFCFDFVLIWIDLKEFQVDSSGNLKHLPITKSLPIKWIGNLKEFHLETHLQI